MFICKCMYVLCQITARNADKKSYLRQVSFCLVFCTRAQMFFNLVSEFACKNTGFELGKVKHQIWGFFSNKSSTFLAWKILEEFQCHLPKFLTGKDETRNNYCFSKYQLIFEGILIEIMKKNSWRIPYSHMQNSDRGS